MKRIDPNPSGSAPRVSRRAQSVPWSPIRKMMGLAAHMPDVINFTAGQPDFKTPAHIVAACKAALEAGHTYYGPGRGILELRERVAEKLWKTNGIQADAETQIIITVGAQEAITLALLTLLDPEDEVILADPGYTNYLGHVPMVSARVRLVPAREQNDHLMTAEDIEAAITGRTRVLLLNFPSNPTGALPSLRTLESYARVAIQHDLIVISDEAYESLVYGGYRHFSIASLPGMAERTVSIFTFSKTYSMTGWRVGYLAGPEDLVEEMLKLQEEVVSCPPTFTQYGAIAALQGAQECVAQMVAEYGERRAAILEGLRSIAGVTCVEPKGAFYVFPNVASFGLSSEEVAMHLLKQANVAAVPGDAFGPGGEGHLRLCYGSTPMDRLKEGIERIRQGLKMLEPLSQKPRRG